MGKLTFERYPTFAESRKKLPSVVYSNMHKWALQSRELEIKHPVTAIKGYHTLLYKTFAEVILLKY